MYLCIDSCICGFFFRSFFEVKEWDPSAGKSNIKTEINISEEDVICLRLAKAGYYNGNLENIRNANCFDVKKAIEYEIFLDKIETMSNTGDKGDTLCKE